MRLDSILVCVVAALVFMTSSCGRYGLDGFGSAPIVCSSSECLCEAGEECDMKCVEGECTGVCLEGSNCNMACESGACDLECGDGATCAMDCPSGDCYMTCTTSELCELDCAGIVCDSEPCGIPVETYMCDLWCEFADSNCIADNS